MIIIYTYVFEVNFYEPEDGARVLHNPVADEGENGRDVTPPNPFIFRLTPLDTCGDGRRRGGHSPRYMKSTATTPKCDSVV